MKFKSKILAAGLLIETLCGLLSVTSAFYAFLLLRLSQFADQGFAMYHVSNLPKVVSLSQAIMFFWNQSMEPLLPILPVCCLADAMIRRYIFRIRGA
ncbi:hypothetical protein WDW86_22195 [Bdellovibrionota bacterium FG-2]